MIMKHISSVLFDLDGTLTDPKLGITQSISFALTSLGLESPASDSLHWCIGPPLKGSLSILLNTSDPELLDNALSFYRARFSEVGIYENAVYGGIVNMLQSISALNIRIFLATSKPLTFASRILKHFELEGYFNGIYGSELDGRLSDKADLIRHILSHENLDPEHTMMIGDRKHDILGARQNHLFAAAVTYGYGDIEELCSSDPDALFDSPEAISRFFTTKNIEEGAAAHP
jgi:phosphoglycolate phosphatase